MKAKKILAAILAASTVLAFAGCSQDTNNGGGTNTGNSSSTGSSDSTSTAAPDNNEKNLLLRF